MAAKIIVKLKDLAEVPDGLLLHPGKDPPLLGNAKGQIFFSPALVDEAANSTIQVDEADACVRAYDTYVFPTLPDPNPLFTFPKYPGTTTPISTLGGAVLWAPQNRLAEACFSLEWANEDAVDPATDSRAIATLEEPLDSTRVSLLNNTYWRLYDGANPSFITAANLTPIPPGPTTVITLQP